MEDAARPHGQASTLRRFTPAGTPCQRFIRAQHIETGRRLQDCAAADAGRGEVAKRLMRSLVIETARDGVDPRLQFVDPAGQFVVGVKSLSKPLVALASRRDARAAARFGSVIDFRAAERANGRRARIASRPVTVVGQPLDRG
jgi:hypothetical protein